MRDVILARPLLKHLATIESGPPSPVAHEDHNHDDGKWVFYDDLAQGCTNNVADSWLCAVYTSIGKFFSEVGFPPIPVISAFLGDITPLLRQASKDLRDVPVLQDEFLLLRIGSECNTCRVIELLNMCLELEEKTTLANSLQAELDEAKKKLSIVTHAQGDLQTTKAALLALHVGKIRLL